MLPVSVLPAAGIMLRLGQPDLLGKYGVTFLFLSTAGNAVFNNLPLIFAVGVAIGFSGGEAVAALAAVIGELILQEILVKQSLIIGTNINMGVFGGILIGLIAAILYNKYHEIKLPKILGFFSGKRFVPIITSISSFVFAIISIKIWVPIQSGIDLFAHWASDSILGPAFYAAGKRLLIPAGIHHIYYPPFLFQFGEYVSNGIKYFGDSPRFFHGDPTAGVFMAAEYPILMFGLPGAALAIVVVSKVENRKKIFGMMMSAALVSFFTGITEPIEFSFIFVAPFLYVFHIVAAFFSGIITSMLNIRLGYTFSASLIDYVLGFNYAENPLLLWIIGPLFFVLYFVVFYFTIKLKNIETPGREEVQDETNKQYDKIISKQSKGKNKAESIIDAVGGKDNIEEIDACVTRLRLKVSNTRIVNRNKLKDLGAAGIFEASNCFQIILGTEAEFIKENMIKAMLNKSSDSISKNKIKVSSMKASNYSKDEEIELEIYNPIEGELISLDNVNDEVFSEKILGDGFAIIPSANKVFAPISGEVVVLFPTKHAIIIKSEIGYEIMIHVGLDTVNLKGEGFTSYINKGDIVSKGDLILSFDKTLIDQNIDTTTPIVVTNLKGYSKIYAKYGNKEIGEMAAMIIKE
ncbi:glucose PTS transporter subunit IIA [Clostridium sediminicola]|uniref:glucose PTS transporter subunit IIA n=1 Tax=Clostridium sediminicola TaxID=3114879 RepID=UPI003D180521